MAPRVSVCIPTYNYATFISSALESVLNQKFSDFEVIVQDDCSSDDTASVVSGFLSDSRVKFAGNERNLGLAANWNICLRKARGEYIKYVFADDLLASTDALGDMVLAMDSDRDISLVASSRNIIDSRSVVLRVESSFQKDFVARGTNIIRRCLYMSRNLIGEPTAVMFRKDRAERGFSGEYRHLLDMEMWLHLLEKGNFAYINRPLCSFRVHPAQKTVENVRERVYLDDYCLLLQQYLCKPYMQIGWVLRNYLTFDAVYQFRKLQKKGLMGAEEASRGIRGRSPHFALAYPVFRLVKPFMKIYLSVLKALPL